MILVEKENQCVWSLDQTHCQSWLHHCQSKESEVIDWQGLRWYDEMPCCLRAKTKDLVEVPRHCRCLVTSLNFLRLEHKHQMMIVKSSETEDNALHCVLVFHKLGIYLSRDETGIGPNCYEERSSGSCYCCCEASNFGCDSERGS